MDAFNMSLALQRQATEARYLAEFGVPMPGAQKPQPTQERPGRWGTMRDCLEIAERERQKLGLRNANSMNAARVWLEQHQTHEALVLAVARLLETVDALEAAQGGTNESR